MASEILNSLIIFNHTRSMWSRSQQQNYSAVRPEEPEVPSRDDRNPADRNTAPMQCQRLLSICLLALTLTLIWAAGFAQGRLSFSDSHCLRQLSRNCMYFESPNVLLKLLMILTLLFILAPLLDDLKIEFSVTQFNGSFMRENVFRQNPSPKVDAAWASLGVDCESSPGKVSFFQRKHR